MFLKLGTEYIPRVLSYLINTKRQRNKTILVSMKKYVMKSIVIFVLALLPVTVFAQTDPEDPGNDPDSVPIDGGVSLLIGAAVVYGAKKIYSTGTNDHKL